MWTREILERHSVDMRQFIEARESTLPNGMRQIEVHNSSGLTFTLLPDRGMDIWSASYRGLSLTWLSQGSPHPPDYGSPWLRQFNGGFLTTCGLLHAGQPETDDQTGEIRDLHGNFSRSRAQSVQIGGGWAEDRYIMEIRATLAEAKMFGEQLRLERTYRIPLGESAFELIDRVTNLSDMPSPFMLLYHFNIGYPLLSGETQFYAPWEAIAPHNNHVGLEMWNIYANPTPQIEEQVFFYHLSALEDGWTQVVLANPHFGLGLAWDTKNAPYFTQWKNIREGMYVSGIEPGNCIPEGQNSARQSGRLVILQPRESQTFRCRVNLTHDSALLINSIETIQMMGYPINNCNLDTFKDQKKRGS